MKPAGDCREPVGQVLEARGLHGCNVESAALISYREVEVVGLGHELNDDARGTRVLDGVLDGLEAAEVDGRLARVAFAPRPVRQRCVAEMPAGPQGASEARS